MRTTSLVAAALLSVLSVGGGCSTAEAPATIHAGASRVAPADGTDDAGGMHQRVSARASGPARTNFEEPAETVASIPGIASVRRLGDAGVELSLSKADVAEGWELYVDRDRGGPRVKAMPIEHVSRHNTDHLGAGWHAFQYLGDRGDYVVFREKGWFYDIVPEWSRLIQVLPYAEVAAGDVPTGKPQR